MGPRLTLLATFLGLLSVFLHAEPAKVPHGTAELIANVRSVHPGSTFDAGLYFELEPGWHVYWTNPGDSGQPPRLKWNLPQGWTASTFNWPVPKKLPLGPLLDYGYEGNVLLPFTITSPPTASLAAHEELKADLRVLVCREVCVPGKASLSLTLPVRQGADMPDPVYAPLFKAVSKRLPLTPPASLHLGARFTSGSLLLNVSGLSGATQLSFIPAEPGLIENGAPQQLTQTSAGSELAIKRAADAPLPNGTLNGLLVVGENAAAPQAYSVAMQVAPAATATVSGSANPPGAQKATAAAGQGLWTILALAFGGGLILNLMPCVFPVLSLKVLSLMSHAQGERRTVQRNAGFYTLGILLSFWLLVVFLLSLRAAGRSLGWGFQLQSPGFVAFLACLLFALALSLVGAFEIGASVMNFGSNLTQGNSYTNSFFTGVLAVVVATPCTAPLMGVAVGFALSQSAVICFVVFTFMAMGLAAPFLVLSLFPSFSRVLPRPGRWMETLKQAMAFPVFATVVWLLWVVGQQVDMTQLAFLLMTLLVLAFAGWMAGKWPGNRVASAIALVLSLSTVAYSCATLTPDANHPNQTTAPGALAWEAFTPAKLAQYRAAGRPILIDFTAAWCLTCQVNDRVLFHSAPVIDRLNRSKIVLLRADWTSYDPAITETLAQYGRSSIPLYVLYASAPGSPAVVLPDGLLGTSTLLGALDRMSL